MEKDASNYVSFRKDFETGELSPDAKILFSWYKSLSLDSNRLDSSALRHCTDVYDIATNPMLVRLRHNLEKGDGEGKNREVSTVKLAVIAGVLSHVTQTNTIGFGYQMGKPKTGSSNSPVSSSWFMKLLRVPDAENATVDDWNTLMTTIIAIVKKLEGNVNIIDIANIIYWWGSYKKTALARGYYENVP